MIAAPYDRRAARGELAPDPLPDAALAPAVAPLLARLLAGEPLDRDQRAVIVGEVLRLWDLEARVQYLAR